MVMSGKVEGIVVVEQCVIVVVCVLRRVLVGAIPVVRQHGSRGGGEPAGPLPPVTLLEHTTRLLQLLGRETYFRKGLFYGMTYKFYQGKLSHLTEGG